MYFFHIENIINFQLSDNLNSNVGGLSKKYFNFNKIQKIWKDWRGAVLFVNFGVKFGAIMKNDVLLLKKNVFYFAQVTIEPWKVQNIQWRCPIILPNISWILYLRQIDNHKRFWNLEEKIMSEKTWLTLGPTIGILVSYKSLFPVWGETRLCMFCLCCYVGHYCMFCLWHAAKWQHVHLFPVPPCPSPWPFPTPT